MWASHRKAVILFIIGAVIATLVALTLIAVLYKAPSCMDNKQNQGETGVDCGGPCSVLCTVSVNPPSVQFVRQLSSAPGRTDVIAYISNTNAGAALEGAKYTITLYSPDNVIVASKQGTVDLPPKSTVPVFVPDFFSGFQTVGHAFLTFDESSIVWHRYTDNRPVLPVSDIVVTPGSAPRITASISNPTAYALSNIPVVVTVFDAGNNAIAASATVLDQIPPMGSTQAIFTWTQAFPADAAREDVLPLVPLSVQTGTP